MTADNAGVVPYHHVRDREAVRRGRDFGTLTTPPFDSPVSPDPDVD